VAEFELTPEILSESFDYIALGHYHGQMQIAPNAWYSGSIEHLTYGEIKDKKGALSVDLDNHAVDRFKLVRSPMKDLGVIDCFDRTMEDIIDATESEVGLLDGFGDQMYQITLDFGSSPVKSVPPDALKEIRESILDLKIRVRSRETERASIQQQDLHAVNYVDEFNKFLQHRQLSDAQRAAVAQCGTETLKTAIANHGSDTE
jgi:DNA repair exonuclease SbcCD nuclease subunit